MHLDSRLKAVAATASLVGLLTALAVGGATPGASGATLPNCNVAQNIEGIIDDSGSMSANDPENYRADLLEALAFFNQEKTMGAVLFGTDASPLFGPVPVGPNFTAIKAALATVDSNAGGTDYDDGFSVANSHNPNANARIFLSDGQPNTDPDPNLWKSPLIKAYVVGFGTADFTVLNQIAADTGGPAPYSIENASQLRTVSQVINAAINCEPAPILREQRFKSVGQTKTIGFKPNGSSAEILISWPTVGNSFKAFFGSGGAKKGSVASIAGTKVKVKSTRGETYVALNVSKLKKGKKVKLRIRAKKLTGPETVTAAIIR
jgi:hypothetical protein